ncbi:MAG: hypothetical protein IJB15_05845 [Clostridia bacterium]|nr:hypothetical protein [Clostridia bacterium]
MKNNSITIASLQDKLVSARVPASYYCLGGYREEALCILSENGKWSVFECERGYRYNEHIFETEADACLYFIKRIRVFL